MPLFNKKPAEPVNAVQWTGSNSQEVLEWAAGFGLTGSVSMYMDDSAYVRLGNNAIHVSVGTWLIQAGGGFESCSDEEFRGAYEVPESEPS